MGFTAPAFNGLQLTPSYQIRQRLSDLLRPGLDTLLGQPPTRDPQGRVTRFGMLFQVLQNRALYRREIRAILWPFTVLVVLVHAIDMAKVGPIWKWSFNQPVIAEA